jgi:hypothetical protein
MAILKKEGLGKVMENVEIIKKMPFADYARAYLEYMSYLRNKFGVDA